LNVKAGVYTHAALLLEELKEDSGLDCREFPSAFFFFFCLCHWIGIHLLQIQIVQQLHQRIE
jgi:hypothetical protein